MSLLRSLGRLVARMMQPTPLVIPHERPEPHRPVAPPRHPKRDTLQPVHTPQKAAPVVPVETVEKILKGKCYVIDGDTIDIGKVRIRLFGIDAPEMGHPYGIPAKLQLLKLCKGQTITAHLTPDMTHDRVVAKCYLPDGRDLSAEMVTLGHAIDWPKYSGGAYTHLEVPGIRKRLWRCHNLQRGILPPPKKLPD